MIGRHGSACRSPASAVNSSRIRKERRGIVLAMPRANLPNFNCEDGCCRRPCDGLAVAVRRIDCCRFRPPVVLLVTSDRDLRESAAARAAEPGYQVLAAPHAGHAVLACMDAPRVDVAAIELSMEDMSGPVLAERLRRRCPGLRSLYLAKAGTPECEGVLVRPFSREDLRGKADRRRCRRSLRHLEQRVVDRHVELHFLEFHLARQSYR